MGRGMGLDVSGLGMGLAQMMQMQQSMMQQFNILMASLGIEIKLERIDVEPRDDPDAIDFVWRLRCRDPEMAARIKEEIVKTFGE